MVWQQIIISWFHLIFTPNANGNYKFKCVVDYNVLNFNGYDQNVLNDSLTMSKTIIWHLVQVLLEGHLTKVGIFLTYINKTMILL